MHPIEPPTNRGKGFAVHSGVHAATGSAALFAGVDGSTPIHTVERFLAAVESGVDLAVESRVMPSSDVRVPHTWWRQSMGRLWIAQRLGRHDPRGAT